MREYTVLLDGQPRTLKYRLEDREYVEALFPRQDGTPASLATLVQTHLIGAGSIHVQAVLLYAGLRHLGDKWTLERVKSEMAKVTQTDGLKELNSAVFKAILAHGVLGKVTDPEPEEGKEQTA